MTKDEKRAAAALLLAESYARTTLRSGVALVVTHHVRMLGRLPAPRVVHAAGRDLSDVVTSGVVDIRRNAIKVGARSAEDELAAVRKALETMPQSPYRGAVPAVLRGETAADVGKRFGEAFVEKAAKRLEQVGTDASQAVRQAATALRSRVDTIAATESSKAFNQARMRLLADAIEAQGGIVLRWVATLDERTCRTCSALSGTLSDSSGRFSGYKPGGVHPRCRCYAVTQIVRKLKAA